MCFVFRGELLQSITQSSSLCPLLPQGLFFCGQPMKHSEATSAEATDSSGLLCSFFWWQIRMSSIWQKHGLFCRHIEYECNEVMLASIFKDLKERLSTWERFCRIGVSASDHNRGIHRTMRVKLNLQWRPQKTEVTTAFNTCQGTMKNLPITEPGMLNLHYQFD